MTRAGASRLTAASSAVTARCTVVLQAALMSYYTGELEPASLRV